ncbi:NADH-quinone oxidoreductase subunit M [Methanosarcinales archaeon ex4572_44]|nr:MAG: NADH-quinone oxidoreductase subunit M [Methanosarcinales archaeon ex4572_44]
MIPYILLQIVVLPVIASIFIFLTRYKIGKKAGWIAGITLLYTTALLSLVGIRVYQGEIISEEYLSFPMVNLNLLADGLSIPIALIMNLCCIVLAFYSIHYVEHRIELIYGEVDKKTWLMYYTRFFILFSFFSTGFMGIAFSTNLITMYFFMELLTIIPLYFIMAQFGYSDFIERYKVALMCLFWGIAGATFFLIGVLLAYTQIGSFEISDLHALSGNPLVTWIIICMLLGLFSKLAIFPLHVWMPWVHAEHPTCIAGLLAVYANIAVYVLVRVIILPLYDDFKVFSIPIMVLALITMIYGSLLAMAQTDVKRFAACSTISQISYSVLGLGALTICGIEGGLFFFLSHIMGKTILFSTAGILVYTTGIRDMRQMGGLASKMPITAILWIMGAMMLSGLPPFSTFTAEWIMFTGIFQTGLQGSSNALIVAILAVSAVALTIAYTFWSVKRIFFGPLNPNLSNDNIRDPPTLMWIPLILLAIVSIILGLYPKPMMDLFSLVIGVI